MNEEIDESEFYHQDFTTASEWEVFIARMEEIINQWKTEDLKNETQECNLWNIRTENLPFADFEFNLVYYKKLRTSETDKQDNSIDLSYDFQLFNVHNLHNESCLSTWYGINEYIVLTPANNVGITSESRIKILLSSVYIVSSNINGEIPIFIQIREKWQHCYLGVYECQEYRTNFEMVHLKRGPQHCQYLTGLLSLFNTKIMSPVSMDPITVSVQFTYDLPDFGRGVWKQDTFNMDSDGLDVISLYELPFGVTFDPIGTIALKTTWSNVPDYVVIDSENYSDFDPLQAPKWSVLIKYAEQSVTLLSDCLTEYLHILNNTTGINDILGDFVKTPVPESNPLDVLTESKVPMISSILSRAARSSLSSIHSHKDAIPISEDILVHLLYFLFPDAEDSPNKPYTPTATESTYSKDTEVNAKNIDNLCRGFKTCPSDSLIWRLSILSAQSLQSLGGTRAFSHLWYEFVQEMRYRWDNSIFISGLARDFSDLRTCLLHQKLQMLNCCIERRKAREENQNAVQYDSAEDSSTDDEFFDCADKPEEDPKKRQWDAYNNMQPVGRLTKFENLKLIETGEFLYIPVTQEPVPKTEDQLEEDTDVLLKLGADAEGSELRAKLMSASLVSDMESFKAANPGSILEDFVRWYSPRDWDESDEIDRWGQKKGKLSCRMLIDDNIWVQMWKSARPVPANRQKRLFDDTREAEKVLHFLESRNVSQIANMLLPVLMQAAIYRLSGEADRLERILPDSGGVIQNLIKLVERVSREGTVQYRRADAIVQEMALLELKIAQVNSLQYKFDTVGGANEKGDDLIAGLVSGREVNVDRNSHVGNRLVEMFSDAQKNANMILTNVDNDKSNRVNLVFPMPNQREFVLRVAAVKPASYSCRCPQYLRAVLSRNDFRLVGAFSEDIVFF